MVQPASASKNLWVAASDGDIDRVRVSDIAPVLDRQISGVGDGNKTCGEAASVPHDRDHVVGCADQA